MRATSHLLGSSPGIKHAVVVAYSYFASYFFCNPAAKWGYADFAVVGAVING